MGFFPLKFGVYSVAFLLLLELSIWSPKNWGLFSATSGFYVQNSAI